MRRIALRIILLLLTGLMWIWLAWFTLLREIPPAPIRVPAPTTTAHAIV